MGRGPEDRPGRTGLDHLPSIHHHDAGGCPRDDAQIVGDQDQAHVKFALKLGERVKDLRLDGDVESGGGLVRDDQRRTAHQSHGDHHALPQTAGKLMRVLVETLRGSRDADAFKEMDGALAGRGSRNGFVAAQRFLELVAYGVGRIERGHRLLEDHRHEVAANV
jgi:hypothetical protein